MREIKYRAWLNKQQRMIDVETIEFMDIGGETHAEVTAKVDHEKGGWYTQIRETTHRKTVVPGSDRQVPRVILRQYTGLKDKNGTEIYERDVTTNELYKGEGLAFVVYYDNEKGMFKLRPFMFKNNGKKLGNKDLMLQMDSVTDKEVIGNIYEHPELLEVD